MLNLIMKFIIPLFLNISPLIIFMILFFENYSDLIIHIKYLIFFGVLMFNYIFLIFLKNKNIELLNKFNFTIKKFNVKKYEYLSDILVLLFYFFLFLIFDNIYCIFIIVIILQTLIFLISGKSYISIGFGSLLLIRLFGFKAYKIESNINPSICKFILITEKNIKELKKIKKVVQINNVLFEI